MDKNYKWFMAASVALGVLLTIGFIMIFVNKTIGITLLVVYTLLSVIYAYICYKYCTGQIDRLFKE